MQGNLFLLVGQGVHCKAERFVISDPEKVIVGPEIAGGGMRRVHGVTAPDNGCAVACCAMHCRLSPCMATTGAGVR